MLDRFLPFLCRPRRLGAAGIVAFLVAIALGPWSSGSDTAWAQTEQQAPQEALPPPHGEIFGHWRIRCAKPHVNGPMICEMFQNVVVEEARNPLLQAIIGYAPGGNQPAAAFIFPLGMSLPPGVTLKIDAGEPMRLAVERCEPRGCIVELPLVPQLLKAMKAGNKGSLTVHDARRRPLDLPISFQGFTKAINTLKPPGQ